MTNPIEDSIKLMLSEKLSDLEAYTNADFLVYYGPIVDGNERIMRSLVEDVVTDNKKETLYIILTTGGGSATAVERYVNIIRYYYPGEVNFIIPDYAYSAGTIFAMSGDNIYMDYFSVLGPIDPQVQNKEGNLVAALGYLDKVNELLEKARTGRLTDAEFVILKDMDLAELRGYEQAKELTIDLLKRWLVKYKFKNWHTHQTSPTVKGNPVSLPEKEERAKEIADALSDNGKWKSHSRPINIEELKALRLKVEDLQSAENEDLRNLVRSYCDVMFDYVSRNKFPLFIQTRKFL
jgi:hypothetical protein